MIATLTLFAACAVAAQERVEIPVKHVSASYIIGLITRTGQFEQEAASKGFVPKGVTIELTPERNSITVSGPFEGVREMAHLIPQFDVAPRAVTLDIKASVPHLSRQFAASTTIYSNSSWTYSNATSGTKIWVKPRVNSDDTITLVFRGGTLGTSAIGAVRIKSGEVVYVWIHPANVENRETGKIENRLVFSSYATLPIDLKSFLTDPDPFKSEDRWTIRPFNADWMLEDQTPLNPPAEADLRIRIVATLPGDRISR